MNTTMSTTRRVFMYVAPVAAVSIALNIPKFLETTTATSVEEGDNSTKTTEIKVADMRLDPTYMLWFTISQIFHPTLTTGILPMAALIYMNTKIYLGIRQTNAKREQRRAKTTLVLGGHPASPAPSPANNANNNENLRPVSSTVSAINSHSQVVRVATTGRTVSPAPSAAAVNARRQQQQQKSEANLAFVLIGIVIMHLACHMLRVFLAGMAVYLIGDTVHCMTHHGGFVPPLWSMLAESVSSILIMINFSGNFLIYCSALKPFREFFHKSCQWWNKGGGAGEEMGRDAEMSAPQRTPTMTAHTTCTAPPNDNNGNTNNSNKTSTVVTAVNKNGNVNSNSSGVVVKIESNGEQQQQQQQQQQTPVREERSRKLLACPQERERVSIIIAGDKEEQPNN